MSSVRDALDTARDIQSGSVSLQPGDGAVLGSYPLEPCRHAGIDPEDPPEVEWVYHRPSGKLVVDLAGEEGEDR